MNDNTPCVDIPSIKHFPIASALPVECPIITPTIDERSTSAKYKKRDYIKEDQSSLRKKEDEFTPLKSPTPTPTVTPTITLTPTVTPTNTPTPANTSKPTPTPTSTPTVTPTVTTSRVPKTVFQLFVNMSVYTEVQFLYSFLTRQVMLFHAVNGPFPLNPIGFAWRVTTNGVVVEQGSAEWNIGWKMTRHDAKRFYQTDDFLKAAAAGYIGVNAIVFVGLVAASYGVIGAGTASALIGPLVAAGPVGWIVAGVIAVLALFLNLFGIGKKKPPSEEPRPQWADPAFTVPINTLVLPMSPSKFKFIPGVKPDTVSYGGMTIEYPPNKENLWNVTIAIKDASPNPASTDDAWSFTLVSET